MSPEEVAVRPLTERHWPEIREIYARGIATGNATFGDQPPTWEQLQAGKLAEHPPGRRLH
jgi:L-amino acid N-acyltransferase YncA